MDLVNLGTLCNSQSVRQLKFLSTAKLGGMRPGNSDKETTRMEYSLEAEKIKSRLKAELPTAT